MGWKRSRVPPTSVHNEATLTKEELERIKLALEIAELRRPWWQKNAYPIHALIGLCSISIMFITGSFQASFLRLENQKFILEQQRKDFEAKSNPKSAVTFTSAAPSLITATSFKRSALSELDLEIEKLLNKKQHASKAKSVRKPQLLFPKSKLSSILVRDQDRRALPLTLQEILKENARLSGNKE